MTWKSLRHPNILPLIGVTMFEAQFVITSEWMVNGNINEFVEANPAENRLDLVRISPEVSLPFFIDNGTTS